MQQAGTAELGVVARGATASASARESRRVTALVLTGAAQRRVHPGSCLGALALAGGKLFEDGPRDLLQIAETRKVLLKLMIEQLRVPWPELISQDHVAELDRVRQKCVFLKLFESLAWIVVIHAASPTSRAPSRASRLLPHIVRKIRRSEPANGGKLRWLNQAALARTGTNS